MNMIDFLAAMAITVHDQTVSIFSNPFLLSNFRGHRKHTAQRHFMLGFNVIDGRNQNIGNNKDVRRRLGRNVAESRDQFILSLIWRRASVVNTHCLFYCVTQHKSMSEFLLSFQPSPVISFLIIAHLGEEASL